VSSRLRWRALRRLLIAFVLLLFFLIGGGYGLLVLITPNAPPPPRFGQDTVARFDPKIDGRWYEAGCRQLRIVGGWLLPAPVRLRGTAGRDLAIDQPIDLTSLRPDGRPLEFRLHSARLTVRWDHLALRIDGSSSGSSIRVRLAKDPKEACRRVASVGGLISACSGKKTPYSRGDKPTYSAGPYFAAGSPRRRNLREPGMPGILLTLRGRVHDVNCRPVSRALLDFFQADSRGRYDRREIRLHGHQFTDERGRYVLRTIVPNHYLHRPPHIHVRVQAANGPILTTELFFPATLRAYGMNVGALNRHARSYRRELTVRLSPRRGNSYQATFDFVIDVASR
jgi:protocatechuate 3,4-dioxygenase beta subunit